MWLEFGGTRAGGCAPPHPPAFRGAPPPRPPKKALRALGCSGCSLSRDRETCLGQTFLRNPTSFFDEATCPGQLRCLGQNFFLRKSDFFPKQSFSCAGVLTYSPNIACEMGFLLILLVISFEFQDLLSWPTCIDLPSPAASSLDSRISHRNLLA